MLNLKSIRTFHNINANVNHGLDSKFSIIVPLNHASTSLTTLRQTVTSFLQKFTFDRYELHFVGLGLSQDKINFLTSISKKINQNRSPNFCGLYFYNLENTYNLGAAIEKGVNESHSEWVVILKTFDTERLSEVTTLIERRRHKFFAKKGVIFKDIDTNFDEHINLRQARYLKNLYQYNRQSFGDAFRMYPREILLNCFRVEDLKTRELKI